MATVCGAVISACSERVFSIKLHYTPTARTAARLQKQDWQDLSLDFSWSLIWLSKDLLTSDERDHIATRNIHFERLGSNNNLGLLGGVQLAIEEDAKCLRLDCDGNYMSCRVHWLFKY